MAKVLGLERVEIPLLSLVGQVAQKPGPGFPGLRLSHANLSVTKTKQKHPHLSLDGISGWKCSKTL